MRGGGEPIAPLPPGQPAPSIDPLEPPVACVGGKCPPDVGFPGGVGMPELEVLDLTSGTWRRLPPLNQGVTYSLADPAELRRSIDRHGPGPVRQ